MEMVHLGSVAAGLFGVELRGRDDLRLLGWHHRMATMGAGGVHSNGPKHRGGDPGAGGSGHADGDGDPENRARRFFIHIEPPEALGAIALIGLLAYALLRGMDPTIAGMLTGLFGVLLGRSTKKNGK